MILALLPLIILCTSKSQAEQLGFYFDANLNSPAALLDDAVGDWQSTSRGKYAYGQARMGSWFKLENNLVVGVEKRINQYINFTPETASFYGQLENNDIPSGVYPLDLSVNSNSTESVYLQYDYDLIDKLSMSLRAYGLIGNLVQIGHLRGVGQVADDGTYVYEYDLNYQYGDNRLFDNPSPAARGYGHSFDLALSFRLASNVTIGLKAEDLLYRLYWSPINQDDGCVARPSPVGVLCVIRTNQVSETQAFPVIMSFITQYRVDRVELEVEAINRDRHNEFWVRLNAKKAQVGFEGVNDAFKIGYQSELLKVEWSFDDYRYHRANHWQISLGTQWAFQ